MAGQEGGAACGGTEVGEGEEGGGNGDEGKQCKGTGGKGRGRSVGSWGDYERRESCRKSKGVGGANSGRCRV